MKIELHRRLARLDSEDAVDLVLAERAIGVEGSDEHVGQQVHLVEQFRVLQGHVERIPRTLRHRSPTAPERLARRTGGHCRETHQHSQRLPASPSKSLRQGSRSLTSQRPPRASGSWLTHPFTIAVWPSSVRRVPTATAATPILTEPTESGCATAQRSEKPSSGLDRVRAAPERALRLYRIYRDPPGRADPAERWKGASMNRSSRHLPS